MDECNLLHTQLSQSLIQPDKLLLRFVPEADGEVLLHIIEVVVIDVASVENFERCLGVLCALDYTDEPVWTLLYHDGCDQESYKYAWDGLEGWTALEIEWDRGAEDIEADECVGELWNGSFALFLCHFLFLFKNWFKSW